MTHRVAHRLNFGRKLLLAAAAAAAVAGPVVAGLLNAPQSQAQPQSSLPVAFEVASIKANRSGARGGKTGISPGGDRFTATNVPVRLLMMTAYGITNGQISGVPSSLDAERYDVEAKAEHPASREQICLMLQTLLVERFKLTLRRETKEMPIYALVVGKAGPKLKLHEGEAAVENSIRTGEKGQVIFQKLSMSRFSEFLSVRLGRSVRDKTGLTGNYDFELAWTPDVPSRDEGPDSPPRPDLSGPSIFTALPEQLGLKLESQKGPVEFLRIEHAERPTEN